MASGLRHDRTAVAVAAQRHDSAVSSASQAPSIGDAPNATARSRAARMKPTDVAPWLNQLNGSTEVIGATGTFSIGPGGDLVNPVIPIYQLTDGRLIQLTG